MRKGFSLSILLFLLSPLNSSFAQNIITPLGILTEEVPSFLFDENYKFQFLAAGGSGSYSFTLSEGVLPESFSLSTDSGVLQGQFDLFKPDSLKARTFTLQVSDKVLTPLTAVTKVFTLQPDLSSYCWSIDLSRNGSEEYHFATNHSQGDVCYIFFEGTGLDVYFGTVYKDLDLPSEVFIDGVAVTPEPVREGVPPPEEWTDEHKTYFEKYRLAVGLEDKNHIAKIVAPTTSKVFTFQGILTQRPIHGRNEEQVIGHYYSERDVLPPYAIYRCADQSNTTATMVDPRIEFKETFLQVILATNSRDKSRLSSNLELLGVTVLRFLDQDGVWFQSSFADDKGQYIFPDNYESVLVSQHQPEKPQVIELSRSFSRNEIEGLLTDVDEDSASEDIASGSGGCFLSVRKKHESSESVLEYVATDKFNSKSTSRSCHFD